MQALKTYFAGFIRNFSFLGIAVFLVVNSLTIHHGGTNAASRAAMTFGMLTHHTFAIDGFQDMTIDLSKTPDGHYYSNKPPGPAILGFPIAWVVDELWVDHPTDPKEQALQRKMNWILISFVESIFLQIIPCIFLVLYVDGFLKRRNYSVGARGIALVGFLFGCTPSFLQNSMFGHGMAAWASLAAVTLAADGLLVGSAACFGIALLADYGAAFLLPGLLWMWLPRNKTIIYSFKSIFLGALIPAILWIWYHTASFGSPFVTSHKFLAPQWVDVPKEQSALWGIFYNSPNLDVIQSLFFGRQRGLLYLEPWILVSFIFGLVWLPTLRKTEEGRVLAPAVYITFIGLLLANSAFNGWHGGLTVGPRYLSVGLALFPLWAALLFDVAPKAVKGLLVGTMGFALIYFSLGFPQSILTEDPWIEFINGYFRSDSLPKIKIVFSGLLVMWCWFTYAVKPMQNKTANSENP